MSLFILIVKSIQMLLLTTLHSFSDRKRPLPILLQLLAIGMLHGFLHTLLCGFLFLNGSIEQLFGILLAHLILGLALLLVLLILLLLVLLVFLVLIFVLVLIVLVVIAAAILLLLLLLP